MSNKSHKKDCQCGACCMQRGNHIYGFKKGGSAWNKLPIEIRICRNLDCGAPFVVCVTSTKKHCSQKCGRKCQKRNKHSEQVKQRIRKGMLAYWKTKEVFGEYPREFNEELKTLIRERVGNTCQRCGRTKKEEGKNLCVHHIDYNKQNCNPKNLTALCCRCNPAVNYHRKNYAFVFLFDKLFEDEITNEEAAFAFSSMVERESDGSNKS